MANATATDGQRIVTISATYGAAGSVVAPLLATALGLRFLDRTVSSSVATAAESPNEAEKASSPPSRWISALAQLAVTLPGMPSVGSAVPTPLMDMRDEATMKVEAEAAKGSVLVLGRAAAVVLEKHPRTFHVRLDGPVDARIARAQQIEHIDAAEARRRCEATDRLRELFVRRLYNRDASDVRLYHLILDTTVLSTEDAVAVLQTAAQRFWNSSGRAS
jgi:hypothetical protein